MLICLIKKCNHAQSVAINACRRRTSNIPIMTGSAKTGLIALDRKFNFLPQTQRHNNTLSSSFIAKMK